jgi:signal transduction histidine kinase/ActR/RegA family two-component response regulator/PAS domain-containing protein
MLRSIARFLQRHRERLVAGVARPLERVFGPQRAASEAESVVTRLRRAFRSGTPQGFLDELRATTGRWTAAGVTADEAVMALLGLVRHEGAQVPATGLGDAIPALLAALPAPAVMVGSDHRVLAANRAFLERTGELAEALPGTALADLLASEPTGELHSFVSTAVTADLGVQLSRLRLAARPDEELLAARAVLAPGGTPLGWIMALAPAGAQVLAEASVSELLEREKRQRAKFAALLTVSNAVVNSLELDTILKTIAKLVRSVIQTDECTVFLFDEKEQVLIPFVCDAQSFVDEMMAVRLQLGEGITGMVAKTGRGEIVNDAEADPRAITVPGTPPEQTALLCVPLLNRDRVVGVITLTRIGDRGFQAEDLELATLFAGQCSAAIANARLYEDMKAAYDQLRSTQAQLVQSAKLNALGEMAGGVAHDFNNILAAILGRTQLLLQRATDADLRRQLAVIEQAAMDGAQTVRRVQEFTRVRQDERFETLDINQVLLGVLELTRPVWEAGAKRRGILVDVHLELQATQPLAGNASELREVFTNLVLNAVDAMPAGGHLWVSSENGGGVVQVQVRDSGLGMDADTRSRIFDPFFTTKDVKGTGLGLSVAYGIVSRHRGTIVVDSEPALGTVFTLTFPVGAVAAEPVAGEPSGPVGRRRVLVVDDEESVLAVLSELLGAMGHEVTSALGGPAGLEALQAGSFEVVFSDLGMPEVNGWDLATTAKRLHPSCAVILVTGWGFQLEEETAAARGVDLVLAKPFSWEDVEGALRQVSEGGNRHRAA